MPPPALRSRWGFVVLLLSALHGTTPREQCTSLGVLYAVDDSNGVRIMSATEGNKKYEIALLRNHSLPSADCDPIDTCMLQCFNCKDGDETVCCTLPVVNRTGDNHLAILQFQQQSDVESSPFRPQDQAILSQDSDCVTAQVFFTGNPEELSVACVNTKLDDQSYIWFLRLTYDSTNISGTAKFILSNDFQLLHLTSPLSLSEFLSLERSECHFPAIFFVANSSVYSIIQQADHFIFPNPLISIPDCFFPLDVSYMHMNQLHLRLQCSEYIAKLFTACGFQEVVEVFDSRNKTVYQCVSTMGNTANVTLQNDLLNVTVIGSPQEFEGVIPSQYFPFMENISYAFCNVGRNVSFVFALRNGSVFGLSLTTGKLYSLSHNSCNSSTNTYARGQCYKTRNTTIPNVIGAYDFEESTFKIANLSCPNNPVVANIEMDSLPPLVTLVRLSRGVCMCPSSGTEPITSKGLLPMSEASLSPTNSYTVSTTLVVSRSSTNDNPIVTPTTTVVSRPTANSKHSKRLWALTGLTLLFLLPVLLVLCYRKRIMKKCSKSTPRRKNDHVQLNNMNPTQTPSPSSPALTPPAPHPRGNPKSNSPTHPSRSPHGATKDPSTIVPQQPRDTDHQDKSNFAYHSLPNHSQTSNGAVPSQPSLPSGNPGWLHTVEQPPPPQATANNNIQQEHSGLTLPYPSGEEVTASSAQETQSPADNINAALVPGTGPQRQTAPVVPRGQAAPVVPRGQAVPQGQGAPVVPRGQAVPQEQGAPGVPQGQGAPGVPQRQAAVPLRPLSSSLSPDPFTGERNRGH